MNMRRALAASIGVAERWMTKRNVHCSAWLHHRVKQSAVYRHLMTPSWAILLITSHVPNAWKPVHVTMIDWVCAINSVAASGDKTAYALLWERWLLSAPYLIPPWAALIVLRRQRRRRQQRGLKTRSGRSWVKPHIREHDTLGAYVISKVTVANRAS